MASAVSELAQGRPVAPIRVGGHPAPCCWGFGWPWQFASESATRTRNCSELTPGAQSDSVIVPAGPNVRSEPRAPVLNVPAGVFRVHQPAQAVFGAHWQWSVSRGIGCSGCPKRYCDGSAIQYCGLWMRICNRACVTSANSVVNGRRLTPTAQYLLT